MIWCQLDRADMKCSRREWSVYDWLPQRNATVITPPWPSVSESVLRVSLRVTVFCILALPRVTLGVTAKEVNAPLQFQLHKKQISCNEQWKCRKIAKILETVTQALHHLLILCYVAPLQNVNRNHQTVAVTSQHTLHTALTKPRSIQQRLGNIL